MSGLAFVSAILPGKQEAWRRFYQTLEGSRHHEYAEFHQRLSITKELVWLTQTLQGEMAIVYLESEHPEQLLLKMAESDLCFDLWFRGQLRELHGFDVVQHQTRSPNELVFAWQRPNQPRNNPLMSSTMERVYSEFTRHKGEQHMSVEQNKALVTRWIEGVINTQNLAEVDEIFTPDYVNHYFPVGLPQGPEGEKIFTTGFFTAFPDGRMTIEHLLSEGDIVAVRWIYRGTHTGSLRNIPPTGKSFSTQGMNIFRIAEGKIAENWASFDMLGLLQQLGVIPAEV